MSGEKMQHPWIEMAALLTPKPTNFVAKVDGVILSTQDGERVDAAFMTVADESGIKTAFFTKEQFKNFIDNCQTVYNEMQDERITIATGGIPILREKK